MNRHSDPRESRAADDPRDLEIELALRRLPLRSPSDHLDARIAGVLGANRSRRRPSLLLAAAAAIAVALGSVPFVLNRTPHPLQRPLARGPVDQSAVPSTAGPLRVERQFARVSDDGVIGTSQGVPVQLLRRTTVRQIWYFDPHTGKKLQVTVPRDQAFLVPVRTF